jgi:AcrR family transcriptional regulator
MSVVDQSFAKDVDACASRGPGRPRDARADEAIIETTLDLMSDVGVTGLSIEEVALRAGVSKATIYRRFESKDALIVAALASLNTELPTELPEGSTRDVLVAVAEAWWLSHPTSRSAQLFPRLFGHARSNPQLFGRFFDQVIEPRRDFFRSLIRRGINRGELRVQTDVELLTTLLISSSVYTMHLRAAGRDVAPGATSADFVDAILAGFLIAPSRSESSL